MSKCKLEHYCITIRLNIYKYMDTGNHSVSGETVFPPVYTIHVYLHAYTNIMGANGNPAVY